MLLKDLEREIYREMEREIERDREGELDIERDRKVHVYPNMLKCTVDICT